MKKSRLEKRGQSGNIRDEVQSTEVPTPEPYQSEASLGTNRVICYPNDPIINVG
jgi:hypothetical protein